MKPRRTPASEENSRLDRHAEPQMTKEGVLAWAPALSAIATTTAVIVALFRESIMLRLRSPRLSVSLARGRLIVTRHRLGSPTVPAPTATTSVCASTIRAASARRRSRFLRRSPEAAVRWHIRRGDVIPPHEPQSFHIGGFCCGWNRTWHVTGGADFAYVLLRMAESPRARPEVSQLHLRN